MKATKNITRSNLKGDVMELFVTGHFMKGLTSSYDALASIIILYFTYILIRFLGRSATYTHGAFNSFNS